MRLLLIRWRDSHGDAEGWTSRDSLDREDRLITSVGIELPRRKRGFVTICQSDDERAERVDNVLHIARKAIVMILDVTPDNLSQ